jgi:hypothetical protein
LFAGNTTPTISSALSSSPASLSFSNDFEIGSSQRMILDRVCPPRKGQPVNVVMPPINTSQDLFAAIASIWTAIREGRLTPDEASALSVVVDRTVQAIELHDITKRIAALEEARDKRDEKNRPPPA